jgi:hypothetical protein
MAAWGSPASVLGDDAFVGPRCLFDRINNPEGPRERVLKLFCLGFTNAGDPIHPMARGRHRIPDDAKPIPFERQPGRIVGLTKDPPIAGEVRA